MNDIRLFVSLLLLMYSGSQAWGQPLFHLSLDDSILPATCKGAVTLAPGASGSCLDLSAFAPHRQPLSADPDFAYDRPFTISVWVKTQAGASGAHAFLGNKHPDHPKDRGWTLGMQPNGAWRWQASDSLHQWEYAPTGRQALNDGQWHLLTFSLDPQLHKARFYFDTDPVAIYHLEGLGSLDSRLPLGIGGNLQTKVPEWESFNGYLDEIRIWDRLFSHSEVTGLWEERYGKGIFLGKEPAPQELKVLSWNIWHGGHEHGQEVGVQRVIEVIKESKADIIAMQETYGSGPEIADALGYYFYLRSSNLSIMSRFPIGETIEVYEPFRCGGAYIDLNGHGKIAFFSLWIHYLPDINALKNSDVDLDSLMIEENKTRGDEIRAILRDLKPVIAQGDSIPVIIAGDYNSGSHLDWTEATRPRHYGHLFPWPVSQEMAAAGFRDAFREVYPDPQAIPGRSWSPMFPESIQERIDYVYYQGKGLKARAARVIDQHAVKFPSDHAAMWIELKIE